jgi:hypothetical protein
MLELMQSDRPWALTGGASLLLLVSACTSEQQRPAAPPPIPSAPAPAATSLPSPQAEQPPASTTSADSQAAAVGESACPAKLDGVVVSVTDTNGGVALSFKGGHDPEVLRQSVEQLGDAYEYESERIAAAPQQTAPSPPPARENGQEATPGSDPVIEAFVETNVNYTPTAGGGKLDFTPKNLTDVELLRALIHQHARMMASEQKCPTLG